MSIYRFKSFVLNTSERQLACGEHVVPLTPKVFDTLVYLVEHAGHLAEKEDILNAVWPDSMVEEVNLARSVHTLRRALGQGEDVFIETVPTRGYRFIAPVDQLSEDSNGPSLDRPETTTDTDSASPAAQGFSNLLVRGLQGGAVLLVLGIIVVFTSAFLIPALFGSKSRTSESSLRTESGQAYAEYQQGKFYLDRHLGLQDLHLALEHFERAVEADPKFVDALVGSADAHMLLFWDTEANDDIVKATTRLETALELDDSNAYAHTVKCRLLTTYEWQHDRAEKECLRAVELDPRLSAAHRELGYLLDSMGRTEEALDAMQKAASLEPTSFNKRSIGMVLYHARRFDDAIAQFRQITASDPGYGEVLKWTTRAFEMKGDDQNAFDTFIKDSERRGLEPEMGRELRETFKEKGWKGVLRRRLEAKQDLNRFIDVCDLAQLGETDRAFEVLEKLLNRHAVMVVTIDREPSLDPIRSDPRFDKVLKRIGLR